MYTLLLALATVPQGTDTTLALRGATRLELSSFEGDIEVSTWTRASVRVEARHDEDVRVEADLVGRSLQVHAHSRHGPSEVRWRLTVPAELALDLSSQSGTINVRGTRAEVRASTVEGDITVEGGAGVVELQSVDGDVCLGNASGRLSLATVDGMVTVTDVRGELAASTVDGAMQLTGITARVVSASTVDGDIQFEGTLEAGGRYRLTSHDGDVTVTTPDINAEVSVSTFSGEFESDFPVTLRGGTGRSRMNFTLGRGQARLELESFDGLVALRRGGARR